VIRYQQQKRARLVYAASVISGFVIMGIELLAGRMLSPYFGSSIYVWGSIITIFMLALSIGYLLGGRWSMHSPSLKRLALLFFVGALLLLPLFFGSESIMQWLFVRVEDPRYGSLLASMVMFLPATLVLGMVAPYAVRLLTLSSNSTGLTAGKLYFVSTFGSAAGTIATSFYLVLWFNISTIIVGFIIMLLLAAIVLGWYSPTTRLDPEAA